MSKRPPGKALTVSGGNDGGSKIPALKSTNFYVNFLALVAAFDAQVKLWDELCTLWRGRNKPVDLFHEVDDAWTARELWTSVREGAEQCLATMNALWTSRMPDPNIHSPSAEWLGWRIGEMTKAWGGDPKMSADEILYMADRLEAENLHGMTWEGIFREIEDTRSKAPTINEMLQFLKKTKHIADWKRRLAAVDLVNFRKGGEETIFALEFKKAVFETAVLEYLDSHGHTDLAAGVREKELDPYLIAIEATAKSEGLSELVAKIEMQNDYSPNSEFIAKLKAGYRPDLDDPWQQARQILKNKKHVMLEWDLLLKKAQQQLNQDKAFACINCGAGYDEEQRCMICECWLVVSHAKWEQHITHELQVLQTELQVELQRLQREQKRREKSTQPRWQQHYEARMVKTVTSAKRALDARKERLLQEQLREAAAVQADLDSYYGANGQLK